VLNSQSRNGFGTLGLSWTGSKGYFGGSYGYDDTRHGAPVVEEGLVELTPRKHAFSLRGGAQGLDGRGLLQPGQAAHLWQRFLDRAPGVTWGRIWPLVALNAWLTRQSL